MSIKERPIPFSGPMVRAILEGRKTQTRRVVKPARDYNFGCELSPCEMAGEVNNGDLTNCPYGKIGDRLWVRESIELVHEGRISSSRYCADAQFTKAVAWPWKRNKLPSIHCPRGLSRITLEITSVRVERLNEVSEADAIAEGIEMVAYNSPLCGPDCWRDYSADGLIPFDADKPIASFRSLWESISGAGSWSLNPWVWVIEFQRVA